MTSSVGGSETYSSAPSGTSTPTLGSKAPPEAVVPPKFEEEEDDLEVAVPTGTTCRHNGCSIVYESDDRHRKEGGAASECTYHPKPVSTRLLLSSPPVRDHSTVCEVTVCLLTGP